MVVDGTMVRGDIIAVNNRMMVRDEIIVVNKRMMVRDEIIAVNKRMMVRDEQSGLALSKGVHTHTHTHAHTHALQMTPSLRPSCAPSRKKIGTESGRKAMRMRAVVATQQHTHHTHSTHTSPHKGKMERQGERGGAMPTRARLHHGEISLCCCMFVCICVCVCSCGYANSGTAVSQ